MMKRTKQIREAITALDFTKAEQEFRKQNSPDDAIALLEIVRQTGCLLIQYSDTARETLRDQFVVSLREWALKMPTSEVYEALEMHLVQATLCEAAYRGIYKTLEQSPHGQIAPKSSAWATILAAAADMTEVTRATFSTPPAKLSENLIFLSSVILRVNALGKPDLDPDVAAERYALNLGGYLMMLGYRERWFEDGDLVIPAEVPILADVRKDRSSIYLAEAWTCGFQCIEKVVRK